MKTKLLLFLLFSLLLTTSKAQKRNLSKTQVEQDLEFLTTILNENASYVYLNDYDFQKDFENYLQTIHDSVPLENFGLFLTKSIGKIGDRHSYIKGFSIDSLFLPFMYAPLHQKVVVLDLNTNMALRILHPKFPYLKKIDGMPIEDFLKKIRPEDLMAPEETYFTRAVRDIRDIQKNYKLLGKTLPEEIKLRLTDATFQNDTTIIVSPVEKAVRFRPWDEEFGRNYILVKDEDYNNPEIIKPLFRIEDNIAYIKLPALPDEEEAPQLFEKVNTVMKSIKDKSRALIIDLRSNGGGTRDLMYEFAKYLVHPDSVYVINATKQRGPIPLPKDYKEGLNTRFLYAFSELNPIEQKRITAFLKTFKPRYVLDDSKYSEYYFGLFNGKKLTEPDFYYDKPVYILANEKTFSAASVFVAAFKGVPNVHIVGVTTDGSSGNSERFELPNSQLRGKISTMVSFQKDGKIFDGFGTEPDIKIERDIDQVLWKSDSQLEKVRILILNQK
ncbi:S41 family peptidase [Autumnicola musiva]|uniref:S41 family peptidase n=1 Tax=Autumnicola musiva TaxID=3075589 RepID=A0ABU3D4Y5_9FLAO|nr:S41 family peptidase [Zunongwangia sp. F117]MDT0676598.1 S41 family peptidase [Zunongwangia sp. F117]